MNLETRLLAGLGQGLGPAAAGLAIHIIVEDVFPAVPTAHDACPAVASSEGGWSIAPGYSMRSWGGIGEPSTPLDGKSDCLPPFPGDHMSTAEYSSICRRHRFVRVAANPSCQTL